VIGEMLQDTFLEFNKLSMLRATNITKIQNKKFELPPDSLISDFLADGDEIMFFVDSINFWLKVNFKMYCLPNMLKPEVDGSIELRLEKSDKIL
jgi:hypothetical protein